MRNVSSTRRNRGVAPSLLALFGAWLACASVGFAQENAEPTIEQRPYQVRAWVSVDPQARLAPGRREVFVEEWLRLVDRFVGTPWGLSVEDGDGPMLGTPLDQVEAETVQPRAEGMDKAWLIRVDRATSGAGFILSGREYDARTRQLGPLYRHNVPFPSDTPRGLLQLARTLFAPVAEIERTENRVSIRVQGASVPGAGPLGRVVTESTVFRPYWILLDPVSKAVRSVREVPFTYLRIESLSGARADCAVVSALRRALPQQVAGQYQLVALGLKPSPQPTRFRFVAGDQEEPASGYVVIARTIPEGVVREVGTTDREGRIVIPPRMFSGLVMLRVLAAGVEPLREVPVLPGESPEERVIPIEPRPHTVALISRLKALNDEIVDLIAQRGRLEARMQLKADAQEWEDVKRLLDDYQNLKSQNYFQQKFEALRSEAERQQAELRVPILTRTAQAELAETESLIATYLDNEAYASFADAYQRYQEQLAQANGGGTPSGPIRRREEPAPAPAQPKPQPKPAPRTPPQGGGQVVPF